MDVTDTGLCAVAAAGRRVASHRAGALHSGGKTAARDALSTFAHLSGYAALVVAHTRAIQRNTAASALVADGSLRTRCRGGVAATRCAGAGLANAHRCTAVGISRARFWVAGIYGIVAAVGVRALSWRTGVLANTGEHVAAVVLRTLRVLRTKLWSLIGDARSCGLIATLVGAALIVRDARHRRAWSARHTRA